MNSLKRINKSFTQCKAYVGYLTVGDGGVEKTVQAALALIKGGVNVLELGMPFSDPVADGAVIQRAAARSLAAGTRLKDVLWTATQIRKHSDIPLILFSYYNPILAALNSFDFIKAAKAAGIDGLLIVDCPFEEMQMLQQHCRKNEIALIYVITPTTPPERVKAINEQGQGFLYYVSQKGTTGMRKQLPANFVEHLQQVKDNVNLPVVVGFGVADKAMAEQILQYADGVVVGSRFVKALEDGVSLAELTAIVQSIYSGGTANDQ